MNENDLYKVETLLREHTYSVHLGGLGCECGQWFPDVVGGRDPRGLWAEHVAPYVLGVFGCNVD